MIKTEFIKLYEKLDTINEVFNYKEEDILSEEEVKELKAKIAELKPQEDKARVEYKAIRNKLNADHVPFSK